MEYSLVFKKKKLLTHAITWMNIEDIMLSELSQIQQDKHHILSLM